MAKEIKLDSLVAFMNLYCTLCNKKFCAYAEDECWWGDDCSHHHYSEHDIGGLNALNDYFSADLIENGHFSSAQNLLISCLSSDTKVEMNLIRT